MEESWGNFDNIRDTRRTWKGFQAVTGHKPIVKTAHCSDPSLPDDLSSFYSRFEVTNTKGAQSLIPSPSDQVLQLSAECVRRAFSRINPRKTHVPDSIKKYQAGF